MPSPLNNFIDFEKIDTGRVYDSIVDLPNQCLHAWETARKVEIPESYTKYNKVVMCGMGGSGLGARIIESLYFKEIKVPLVRINDYNLPAWTDRDTLVICSSYSGNTEETVNNYEQAKERGSKILVIGSGGKLIEKSQEDKIPHYVIEPKYNPSDQPRMAIGYSVIGQLVLASKINLIKIEYSDILECVTEMKNIIEHNKKEIVIDKNSAKDLAESFFQKIIIYISAEHLTGATHTINNQLNENTKNFSCDFVIPELNHHIMEGLKHPISNTSSLFVFLVDSNFYSKDVKKRVDISRDIIAKNNIDSYLFNINSKSKLSESFSLIQFGAFVNFYSAMLYKQNPSPIPWVDYFKKEMSK